jgi:hypothetical protein
VAEFPVSHVTAPDPLFIAPLMEQEATPGTLYAPNVPQFVAPSEHVTGVYPWPCAVFMFPCNPPPPTINRANPTAKTTPTPKIPTKVVFFITLSIPLQRFRQNVDSRPENHLIVFWKHESRCNARDDERTLFFSVTPTDDLTHITQEGIT